MALFETIQKDIIAAQKSGKADELGTLRLFFGALKNREIEKRGKASAGAHAAAGGSDGGASELLTDAEVIDVLQKEAKKRKEAITLYEQGNRPDLAAKEKQELELLYRYIPRELSREEVERIIGEVMAAEPSREFSVVMKKAMEQLKGKADGKVISEIIKAKLGA